uniref:Secreted protein n=1 Tax=Schistosoma curassoni TaxID=6186 RepID=A0A183KMF0_9TREM
MIFPTTTVYVCCFCLSTTTILSVHLLATTHPFMNTHTPFNYTCNSITFFPVLFYTYHTYYSKLW